MTQEQPRDYPRSRRVMITDDPPPASHTAAPAPPTEGYFDYGDTLGDSAPIRYRKIKAVEGEEAAIAWLLGHVIKLELSGGSPQEIAKQLGFSMRYTYHLIKLARAKIKVDQINSFDAHGWVAEHLTIYKTVREKAFMTFQHPSTNMSERTRSHEALLLTMRQEAEFIRNLGGLKGSILNANTEDDATRAAKEMGKRLKALTDALEEVVRLDPGEDAADAELDAEEALA